MKKKEFGDNSTPIVLGQQILAKIKQRAADKKELVSNDNYILWLENFTSVYKSFSDDSWLYKPEELSEVDAKNVERLSLFFEALSEYCAKYYINTSCNEEFEAERINIRHNGVGYQIGCVVGQGAYVYVERKAPRYDAIEFADVVNDVAPQDFESKKDLLSKFEQIVTEMKARNIPKSVILEIAEK